MTLSSLPGSSPTSLPSQDPTLHFVLSLSCSASYLPYSHAHLAHEAGHEERSPLPPVRLPPVPQAAVSDPGDPPTPALLLLTAWQTIW